MATIRRKAMVNRLLLYIHPRTGEEDIMLPDVAVLLKFSEQAKQSKECWWWFQAKN